MDWVLVGYIAKHRVPMNGWVSPWADPAVDGDAHPEAVYEICSVSQCRAHGFGNDKDPLCLFASAEQAWAAVPVEQRNECSLYAYRLWPIQFEEGLEEEIELWWEPDVAPLSDSFVRLGWDAVVGGNHHSFGCSPMSCNMGSSMVHCSHLNRYCLAGNEQAAMELACRFSIDQPEPGPYCVVEVLRDALSGAEPTDAPE